MTFQNKKYIGIDIGLDGAFSVIQNDKLIESKIMPTFVSSKNKRDFDILSIVLFLEKHSDALAILEKVHAMPLLGTVQSFNLGKAFGILLGILSVLKMKYHIVHAKRWQKEMFSDINYKDTKQASAIIASRLFPDSSFLATERSKKKHSGLTDSVLIAEWARRQNI